MCDTYVSLSSTSKANTVFGKNSDRLEDEAQLITYSPRIKYSIGEDLKCTYISIPQVQETAAVLLSQPWWMWGAEMGASEYGVAIGNEAVATKEKIRDTGLLGMDLLRLGLERGKTAKEALKIITEILEKYGQGGICNSKGLKYHNSFIIADPKEAYVLETADEWWIAEIVKDYRSISNNISIRGKGDFRRKGIIQHAIESNYCKDDNDFDFAMIFSPSPIPDKFPPTSRDGCSMKQLTDNKGRITPALMMEFLREHEVEICMHGRSGQSTGSQVSHLKQGNLKSIHWFTGSTIPCLSIYKPYVFPVDGQQVLEPIPYSEKNFNWFWSRHAEFIKKYKKKPKIEKPERLDYYNKIREIERELLSSVNNIVNQENKISDLDFVNQVKEINQFAWKKSYAMINM